jgi:hypothetical protein
MWPTAAAQAGSPACPTASFLHFYDLVYASEKIPAELQLQAGEALGEGNVDQPRSGGDPCKRERRDVQVVEIVGVDPAIAVLVKGGEGFGFILGGRCTGIESPERWPCVLEPLAFDGTAYTAVSYPAEPGPRQTLKLGAELGQARLGDQPVTARSIAGIDSRLAVGITERPSEVFVAPGVCPYERFANDQAQDDLFECLRAPVWFTLAPLGGKSGDRLTASADRAAPEELDGVVVGLLRLDVASDVLPDEIGGLTALGALDVDTDGHIVFEFTIPDLQEGLYELVVTCDPCSPGFDGRTVFPAGSFLLLGERASASGGSSSAKIVYIVVFGFLLLAIVGALVLWRRGYRFRRQRRPSS